MLVRSISRRLLISDRNNVTQCALRLRSAAAAASETEVKARSLDDIPSPPSLPLLGHLPLILDKKNADDMTSFAAGLHEKYGDIVR